MIASLLWKEYREQRGAWLALTAIGCALIAGFAQLLHSSSSPDFLASRTASLIAAAVLLAWCYGMVSGALLLAGERENDTLLFLDLLPVRRGWLWRAKGLAALCLLVAHVAVVLLVLASLGAAGTVAAAATAVAILLVGGLVGLAWGLFCSARVETVLSAIFRAAGLQSLAVVLAALLFSLLWVLPFSWVDHLSRTSLYVGFAFAMGAVTVVAGASSARIFSLPDRLRLEPDQPAARVRGLLALLWLTVRQLRWFAVVISGVGLMGGLAVYWNPLLAWPVLTLILGVACGVRAFGGDNVSPLLLTEQRLPLAAFGLARVTACALIACAACLLALAGPASRMLPSLLSLQPENTELNSGLLTRLFGDRKLEFLVPAGLFLSLWVLHGFTAGLLGGLLWRRTLIAAVLALVLAAAGVLVWLPSLIGDTLHGWQILGMPTVFALASGLLLPAWAQGGVSGRRRALNLAMALSLAAVWTGAGLWYRAIEVPPVPEEMNVAVWLATLPDPAGDETGRLTRQALLEVGQRRSELNERPTRPLFPQSEGGPPFDFNHQLSHVLNEGWPGGEPELSGWLDRMFDNRWPNELAHAAEGPPGIVLDARQLSEPVRDPLLITGNIRLAAELLAVHGLRQQARGDHRAMAKDLRTGLALTRNLRYRAPGVGWFASRETESTLLFGLLRWMERVRNRREALRATLEVLREHDLRCPRNPDVAAPANYLMALNSMPRPQGWLVLAFRDRRHGATEPDRNVVSAFAFLLQAPWERARQVRIFGWLLAPGRSREVAGYLGWPWDEFPSAFWTSLQDHDATAQTIERARLLQVALRLYRAEKGHEAPSLQALVPQYLSAVPADPLDPTGHAFRYRLSAGETIPMGWTVDPKTGKGRTDGRRIRKGQGILWSVGRDGRDDGGRHSEHSGQTSADWIFLLDPPSK